MALIILALLQVADWLTTRTILSRGGRELNPAIRWFMGRLGVDLALAVKTAFVMALGWLLSPWGWVLAVLCAFYAFIVWRNWRVLKGIGE